MTTGMCDSDSNCWKTYNLVAVSFLTSWLPSIFFAIGLTELINGSLYFNSCPRDKDIPIYMVVAGSFSVFFWAISVILGIAHCCKWYKSKDKSNNTEMDCRGSADCYTSNNPKNDNAQCKADSKKKPTWIRVALISMEIVKQFLFSWTVYGAVNVFEITNDHTQVYNSSITMAQNVKFCDKNLYNSAFGTVIARISVSSILLIIGIIYLCQYCINKSKRQQTLDVTT